MVVSEDDIKEQLDTTENCFEDILKQESCETKNIFSGKILQEIPAEYDPEEKKLKKDDLKKDTENFEIINEKQYNLFRDFVPEDDEEKKEEENFSETNDRDDAEILNSADITKETEIIDERAEEEIPEEIYEPKTVEVNFEESMGKFETALEIKYNSLKLSQFPIKISNIPEGMVFPHELTIGNADIKIGSETIKNCHLKVVSNESIKLLKIKHREFKLALSISLNNDTIKNHGSVRAYEISSLIKYSRMIKVLEMFEKIFNGAVISFKVKNLYGDIEAEDRIELMKIKTIQNFFETLEKSGCRFEWDKLPQSENVYYLLELYSALKENKIIETWCNFNLNKETLDLREKDSLIIKRKHTFDKNIVIEEKIILKTPLSNESIFKDKIAGYRKLCVIELSKGEN